MSKSITYKGYKIESDGFNFRVRHPKGWLFSDPAATRATARKWIDADIIERREKFTLVPVQAKVAPFVPQDVLNAFEFGYLCCEKGMNLDAAREELRKHYA